MKIELRDLEMRFGDVVAVHRLNATFDDGELVSLLGPSGCGKSTTLFLLAGLYKPTGGAILFDGKVINDTEPEHRHIGMVFQNYALYPHMTVRQNIAFPLRMLKVPKAEQARRVEAMAELVKISHLLDRKPAQLSGGQQQRVAIARALVKEPKVLLLDEPLSNLDARLRLEMREEIRRIQQEVGITTIFVTHDQEEAMSISDRILLMKDGKIQQFDKPQTMYDAPSNLFVAEFLGTPPINVLKARSNAQQKTLEIIDEKQEVIQSMAISDPFWNIIKETFPGSALFSIGIRPESAHVKPLRIGTNHTVKTHTESHVLHPSVAVPHQKQDYAHDHISHDAGSNWGTTVPFSLSGTIVYRETIGRDSLVRVDLNARSADSVYDHVPPSHAHENASTKKQTGDQKIRAYTSLRLLVPAHQKLEIGMPVEVEILPEKMHLFSETDGARLSLPLDINEPQETHGPSLHEKEVQHG